MEMKHLKFKNNYYKTAIGDSFYCKRCAFCQGAGCALHNREESKICLRGNIYWVEDKFPPKKD